MAHSINSRRFQSLRECVGAIVLLSLLATGALAVEVTKEPVAPSGSVEFDCPGLPEPTVEFNLSQGMFKDLFGIGDAAITGVVQGLTKSAGATTAEAEQVTAQQLEAAHQMLELVGQVVQGFRVRMYEDGGVPIKALTEHYGKKLSAQNWETVLRVRSDDEQYVVNVLRNRGGIKGVFVIVCDGESTVLANVMCDVSPENIRKLTSSAASLGVKVNMGDKPDLSALNFLWHAECSQDPPPAPVGD
jgi:hypothetical protein